MINGFSATADFSAYSMLPKFIYIYTHTHTHTYIYIYIYIYIYASHRVSFIFEIRHGGAAQVRRSGPNLESGTMRVYITNGPRNGLNIGRKVSPCPGSRRRWVLGSVHALSQPVHAAETYRHRFQVKARPS